VPQQADGLWPFLVSGNLLRDSLQFGASAAQGIGLYGDDPTDRYGIAPGLWVSPDGGSDLRTFLSTAAKASTAKNAAVDASKFATRENQRGETVIDTGKNASNPGIVELTVAACNPSSGASAATASDPELWAALVHQLRRVPA
jgi:RNaseH domain of pPIWI_RE